MSQNYVPHTYYTSHQASTPPHPFFNQYDRYSNHYKQQERIKYRSKSLSDINLEIARSQPDVSHFGAEFGRNNGSSPTHAFYYHSPVHRQQQRYIALTPPLLRSPNSSRNYADPATNTGNAEPQTLARYRGRHRRVISTGSIHIDDISASKMQVVPSIPDQLAQLNKPRGLGGPIVSHRHTYDASLSSTDTSFDSDSLRTQTSESSVASVYSGQSFSDEDNKLNKHDNGKAKLSLESEVQLSPRNGKEKTKSNVNAVGSEDTEKEIGKAQNQKKKTIIYDETENKEKETNTIECMHEDVSKGELLDPLSTHQIRQISSNSSFDLCQFNRGSINASTLDSTDHNRRYAERKLPYHRKSKSLDDYSLSRNSGNTESRSPQYTEPDSIGLQSGIVSRPTPMRRFSLNELKSDSQISQTVCKSPSLGSKLKGIFSAKSKSDTDDSQSIKSTKSALSIFSVRSSRSVVSLGNMFRRSKSIDLSNTCFTPAKSKGTPATKAELGIGSADTPEEIKYYPQPPKPALQSPIRYNAPSSTGLIAANQESSSHHPPNHSNGAELSSYRNKSISPQNLTVGDIFPGALKSTDVETAADSIERTGSLRRQPSESKRTKDEFVPNAQEIEVGLDDDAQSVLTSAMKRENSYPVINRRRRSGHTDGRHVHFASQLLVYRTYSSQKYNRQPSESLYDRLGEPGVLQRTCEELNHWKALMTIHPDSTMNTHWHNL